MKTTLSDHDLKKILQKYKVARPQPEDKSRWLEYWQDYAEEDVPAAAVLDNVWTELNKEENRGAFFLYEKASGNLIGFVHYILHPSNWHEGLNCYVEDGYVVPAHRRSGAFYALYEVLIRRAHDQQWQELYWMTLSDNLVAQRFYNRIARRTNWLRYEYDLKSFAS